MKILFVTPTLPLPPFSGGQVRSLNLLKQLKKHHQVTLVSFIRDDKELGYSDELKTIVTGMKTFKRRPVKNITNLRYLANYPFAAALYFDPVVASFINKEITNGYDLIHFESFYTFPYLKSEIKIPKVAGNQNVEYYVYERFADTKKEPLKSLLKFDISRMKNFEEQKWRTADLCLAVSKPDSEIMEKVVGKKVSIIPNGIDPEFFGKVERNEDKNLFLFVGPTTYIQNNDAAKYLVESIWPKIKELVPNGKLWFVGNKQQKWLLGLNNPDIKVQTDLVDIREAYRKASMLIAPLRAGSGTKFKVLEAFASRIPVVTSSVGIEGIDAIDNESVLIANTPDEYAQKARALLDDRALNARITSGAQTLVIEKYSWDKIGQALNSVYSNLV